MHAGETRPWNKVIQANYSNSRQQRMVNAYAVPLHVVACTRRYSLVARDRTFKVQNMG